MKKIKNNKIIMTLLLICVLFTQVIPTSVVRAEINYKYTDVESAGIDDKIPSSIILEWIGSIAYSFASFVEELMAKIMSIFTGVQAFPWADKIIFNTTPLFDVNFINPSNGSLFRNTSGEFTTIGEVVRNVYFTGLSIALSFLGIIVAVNAIRLLISTIGLEKAKYKQAIMNALTTLVLLFALHYVIAFVFFLNETLVETASYVLLNVFTDEEADDIVKGLEKSSLKDDKAIVENFIKKCDPNWLSPITILRETLKEIANVAKWIADQVVNAIKNVAQGIKDWWDSLWSGEEKEGSDYTLSPTELDSVFPRRARMAEEIMVDDAHIHVAAYLLKSYTYREVYLKWVSGTDVNSISNNGLVGVARGIVSSVNDFLGIIDTGYLGLRSLKASQELIFEGTYTTMEEDRNQTTAKEDEHSLKSIITSTEAYHKYMKELSTLKDNASDSDIKDVYQISMIYAEAYYKFVYDGDDKAETTVADLFSSMGSYFKSKSMYIDLDEGEWAPKSVSIVYATLYAIFVIQSMMFVFAYIKRLFYVIILALLGPIVVVFDYLTKSI